MTNKPMKRCSTSLTIREMKTKTIIRYHFIPIKMAIIKMTDNKKCWQEYGEIRILKTACGNVNDTSTLEMIRKHRVII